MEDYLEELVEGALGLESGTAIAHFAVKPLGKSLSLLDQFPAPENMEFEEDL